MEYDIICHQCGRRVSVNQRVEEGCVHCMTHLTNAVGRALTYEERLGDYYDGRAQEERTMYTVTWHYADSKPFTQGRYETRDAAEAFVAYVESNPQRHRQTHTHATIDEVPDPERVTVPSTGSPDDAA